MLVVICPTRERPAKAAAVWDAFRDTKTLADTRIEFVVDSDDAYFMDYMNLGIPVWIGDKGGQGMAAPVNAAAEMIAPLCDIVGFVGDDHLFRTKGWDDSISDLLTQQAGFAYANDLARSDIPTQVFINSKIVLALGWMCLPEAHHLYLDDAWRFLGTGANCYYYVSSVIIEHVHPFYGKGEMDAGYARVNASSMYEHDGGVFREWIASGQAKLDVETVRKAIA